MPTKIFCEKRNCACNAKSVADFAEETGGFAFEEQKEQPLCRALSDYCEFTPIIDERSKDAINTPASKETAPEKKFDGNARCFELYHSEHSGVIVSYECVIKESTVVTVDLINKTLEEIKPWLINNKIKVKEL